MAYALFIPSVGDAQKYLGTWGVLLYLFVASALLWLYCRFFVPRFLSHATESEATVLAGMTLLVVMVSFAAIYPIANSGYFGGGADRDDVLNIATRRFLRGDYPYYAKTQHNNPLTAMPGELIFAAPFVMLGNCAYQNFFWLAIFFVVARDQLRDGRRALLLLWAILGLSPVVMHEILTGGSLVANSMYVLVLILFLIRGAKEENLCGGKKILCAVLLGVALSSHLNFFLLLPLLLIALARRAGWPRAIGSVGFILTAWAGVTLPFYLYDPAGFSPLHTAARDIFAPVIPGVAWVVAAITAGLAVGLAMRRSGSTEFGLLCDSAIVQAVPVVGVVATQSIESGELKLIAAGYGLFFLFFGALGAWMDSKR